MALFPANPTNGETTVVNGITYTYNSAQTAWIRTSTIPPGDLNITGNVIATGNISGSRLVSNVATGTAPLTVSSTTLVTNLNADLLDGYNSAVANTANTVAVRNSDGNLAANFFIGNGSQLTGIITSVSNVSNGNSNLNIPASNGNINLSVAGNSNILVVTGTGVNVAGTLNTGTGIITGNGSGLSAIAGANVTGAVAFATTANSVAGANVSGQVANALVAGTVYTAAQPNITSVGNLTALVVDGIANVTGNVLAGGVVAATGNVSGGNLTTAGALNVTGNANVGNIGATNGVFTNVSGNGSSLSSITGANVTGAVAFATTANAVAGANVSGQVGNALVAGTVYTAAQPNITSVGTLTSAAVTGNVTAGNVYANSGTIGASIGVLTTGNIATINSGLMQNGNSNVTITANGNVILYAVGGARVAATSTGANVLGTLGVSGNANVDNLGATQILASANVTAPQLISNVATGTAPFVVTSTTQVANLNAATAGTATSATSATNAAALLQNTSTATTVYPTFSTSGANGNSQAVINNSITANLGNASITATTFVGALSGAATTAGTVTTAAQPNITSVGTLTSLGVSGTVTAPAFTANTGVFTGNGSGLSAIAGANVTGTVSAATTAGTVTTAAQPNITSVGTLSSLAVTANANVGNLNSAGRIIATDNLIVGSSGGEGGQLVLAYAGVNGITGQANSTWNMDVDSSNNFRLFSQNATGVVSAITMAAYSANNNVAFAGNVSAPYFIGNGSQLTGITVAAGSSIVNGTSNVVVDSSGNVRTSVAGTANVMVVSSNTVTAPIFAATNNGNGTNFKVGDDAWLGDVNQADTVRLMGQQDAANGYLVFGNADNTGKLGRAGTGPLTYAGGFTAANVIISNAANGTAFLATGNAFNNVALGISTTAGTGANMAIRDVSTVSSVMYFDVSVGNTPNGSFQFRTTNSFTLLANISTSGLNLNTGVFTGNGNGLSSIAGANVTGQVGNALVAGTVYTAAQPNITSVGTLTSLGVNGTVTAVAFTANTGVFTGNGSGLSAIAGANVTGTVSAATTAGTVTTAAQPNITSVGTLTSASVTGNVTAGNVYANSGTIGASLLTGTLTTAAQPNVTSVGTLTSASVTGNVTAGNVYANSGTIGASLLTGTLTTAAQPNITSVGTLTSAAVTGNVTAGNVYANSGTIGASLLTGTLTTAAQPNITSVGTLTSATVTGNVAAGNLTTTGVLSVTGTGVSSIAGNLDMTSNTIINLATPTNASDAATKQYVDDVAQGLNIHDSCQAATPNTLAIVTSGTITYNNGSSGVGANLTTTGSFNLIDGVNVQTAGTRILVKNEANAVHNGIYTWSNATVITRATDFNSVPEVEAGDFVFVTGGTLYDNTGWVQTSSPTAIGTAGNTIDFTQFSGAGTYQAGTGLTLTGSTFSVNASQTQITSVGTLTGLNSSGTITAPAFTANTGVFTGNGSGLSAIAGANVTGTVSAATTAGTVTTAAQPNITSVSTSFSGLTFVANAQLSMSGAGSQIDGVNLISANFFSGNGSSITALNATNITSGTLAQARLANSNVILGNTTLALGTTTTTVTGLSSVTSTTFVGALTGAATTAGTVTTAAQPNITSVGTLTSLAVTGNASAGNLNTAGAVVASTLTSNVATGTAPLTVTSTTRVANLNVSQANVADFISVAAGTGNNFLIFANAATGNITELTSTGLTANLSNNSITATTFVGALSGAATSATTAGTVTTAAQPNITSVGTLTSLGVNGTVTAVAFTANTGVFTGNGSGLSAIAGANVTGTVASATAATNASALLQNTSTATTVYPTFSTSSANGNSSAVINTGISANLGNASITATTFVGALSGAATSATTAGTVTTAAQPNITSVGTLTSLGVSGTVTAPAFTANTGIFTGNGSGLSAITGANVTGTVSSATSATTAGTVTTAAQPNITSVGTLTSLGVNGTVTAVAFTANTGVFTGNGSGLSAIAGANVTGTVSSATSATTAGTVTTAAQPNITSVGTLTVLSVNGTGTITTGNITTINSGLMQNGNSNVTITANGNVTLHAVGGARIIATSTGANVTGTLGVSGNANVLNLGTAQVLATANVIAPQLISNVATGTAPLVVTSTTQVANLNAATAGTATSATSATTAGTVTTAAQPNITSVGTLTSLGVSGTVTAPAFTANTGIFTGNGSALTALNASNISTGTLAQARLANTSVTLGSTALTLGSTVTTVAGLSSVTSTTFVGALTGAATSATTAGTVTTAAQPNITSVGTLTGLTSSGAVSITNSTAATSRTTGALIVTGGIGASANSFFTNLNVASNIAYVAPNGANTITNQMLNGGTLAWTGNAGQLFSITDSMTGNIFTVNDVSGIPMISVDAGGNIQFAASGGFVSYGVTTAITAAGSTQGTATALTRPINVVSTVSASTGVILPSVPPGARILVINTSGTALNVYPPSGAAINSAATNAAYSHPAGARLEFVSVSATQWYTLNATYG